MLIGCYFSIIKVAIYEKLKISSDIRKEIRIKALQDIWGISKIWEKVFFKKTITTFV